MLHLVSTLLMRFEIHATKVKKAIDVSSSLGVAFLQGRWRT